ncbi:enoyl-CoA hydratase [Pigmentiphaga soli]|uniref:Enoyl-CoA hydratase n=1 Tax=Pigmentiphaga soli TaxID=1007095 RepID=A0ABP8H3J0_9BURK
MNNIVLTVHEGWAHLRIARPEKRNALDSPMRLALLEHLAALSGQARAIVLTGADGWFCCGADLKERAQRAAQGLPDVTAPEGIELACTIKTFPGVVIAAVNGLTLGYGVNLVNCCDLAIAADGAEFGLPEVQAGGFASMSAATGQLSGINRKRIGWLLYSAERLPAATAATWGLVNEVVAPDALAARAEALARRIASFEPAAVRETKAALAQVPDARHADWRAAMEDGQTVAARIRQARAAT